MGERLRVSPLTPPACKSQAMNGIRTARAYRRQITRLLLKPKRAARELLNSHALESATHVAGIFCYLCRRVPGAGNNGHIIHGRMRLRRHPLRMFRRADLRAQLPLP